MGSDASAAGGGESELSEWQRSTDAKALRRRRQMSGTATGVAVGDDLVGAIFDRPRALTERPYKAYR